MNFTASDYKEYNESLGYYGYEYLHRLFHIIYKLHSQYNLPTKNITYYDEDEEGDIEKIWTLNIDDRIEIHQHLVDFLFKNRHKYRHYVRQLKLF